MLSAFPFFIASLLGGWTIVAHASVSDLLPEPNPRDGFSFLLDFEFQGVELTAAVIEPQPIGSDLGRGEPELAQKLREMGLNWYQTQLLDRYPEFAHRFQGEAYRANQRRYWNRSSSVFIFRRKEPQKMLGSVRAVWPTEEEPTLPMEDGEGVRLGPGLQYELKHLAVDREADLELVPVLLYLAEKTNALRHAVVRRTEIQGQEFHLFREPTGYVLVCSVRLFFYYANRGFIPQVRQADGSLRDVVEGEGRDAEIRSLLDEPVSFFRISREGFRKKFLEEIESAFGLTLSKAIEGRWSSYRLLNDVEKIAKGWNIKLPPADSLLLPEKPPSLFFTSPSPMPSFEACLRGQVKMKIDELMGRRAQELMRQSLRERGIDPESINLRVRFKIQ